MGYSPNLPIDRQDIDDLDFESDKDIVDILLGDDDDIDTTELEEEIARNAYDDELERKHPFRK